MGKRVFDARARRSADHPPILPSLPGRGMRFRSRARDCDCSRDAAVPVVKRATGACKPASRRQRARPCQNYRQMVRAGLWVPW
jgi:hypothetical protein